MKEGESKHDNISASLSGTGCWGLGGGQRRYYNAPQKVALLRKYWAMCVENLEEEGRFYVKVTFRNRKQNMIIDLCLQQEEKAVCSWGENGVTSTDAAHMSFCSDFNETV